MPTSMAWFTAPPHTFLLISSNRFARFKEPCSVWSNKGKFISLSGASSSSSRWLRWMTSMPINIPTGKLSLCERPGCGHLHHALFGSRRFCSYKCSRSAGGRATRNRPVTNAVRDKKRKASTGRHHTAETRRQMSIARRRWWAGKPRDRARDASGKFTKLSR